MIDFLAAAAPWAIAIALSFLAGTILGHYTGVKDATEQKDPHHD